MNERRESVGFGLLALVPIACCVGLPVLAAVGVSIGAAAWAGGVTLAVVVLIAGVVLLAVRVSASQSQTADLDPGGAPMSNGDRCKPAPNDRTTETGLASEGRPLVEILYFDGCPNHHPAIALVERLSRELEIEPNVQLVNVPDRRAAQRLRFLGSPTVRVGGIDVDPHTEDRDDYALSCRIFRTETGFSGQPDERWVRDALLREAGVAR